MEQCYREGEMVHAGCSEALGREKWHTLDGAMLQGGSNATGREKWHALDAARP